MALKEKLKIYLMSNKNQHYKINYLMNKYHKMSNKFKHNKKANIYLKLNLK
jgi:hypothetical protein